MEPFKLSIQLGDTLLEGSGKTALEALEAIDKPVKIITKGKLTLRQGEKKTEMLMTPIRLKRLFYPGSQFYQARNLQTLLK